MNKSIIWGVFCLLLISCKNETPSDNTVDIIFQGDTVIVSKESVLHSKIKTQTIELGEFSAQFNTTGVVKAMPGQLAEIAPLFDGRVTKSFVKLGQKVKPGTPLFEIYSSEFSETVKDYFQALQSKKLATSNFQRKKDLSKNGLTSSRELEEAEADYEMALKDYENAVMGLKIVHIDPEKINMGEALTIVSPIAGEVVQANIVIGQYMKSDAEPLAIVAELSKVWVVAQVKERNIGALNEDDKVEIRTDAFPGEVLPGQIAHISELLDEESRSVQVMIVCDNEERKLKPGMFANVHFINSPRKSIVIPSTALLQNEEQSYVFVQESKGRYVRRRVEVATANLQEVMITKGLQTGDVIVAEGGIYLMGN